MSAPPRVLVVDDDPACVSLLRDILSRDGLAVESAATASECFERLCGPPPQLILLDIMLPDVDGLSALGRIRGATATAGIPVIVISTLSEKSYRLRARELGAAGYLVKPFDARRLVDEVRRAVGKA